MRLVRRTSCALVLATTLTVSLATAIEALAQQAEIAGIEKVYLRPSPGTEQVPLGVLSAGDRVNILDIEGSWTKVQTADGKVGYVYHRYVVPLAEGGIPPVAPRPVAPVAPAIPSPFPRTAPSPAPFAPSPVPTTPEAAKDAVSAELAGLRAELSDLKEKVQKRATETVEGPERSATPSTFDARPASPAAVPAAEQGVGVLAVAFLSLLVGWVLGAAFSRRRTKSQRRRLRF